MPFKNHWFFPGFLEQTSITLFIFTKLQKTLLKFQFNIIGLQIGLILQNGDKGSQIVLQLWMASLFHTIQDMYNKYIIFHIQQQQPIWNLQPISSFQIVQQLIINNNMNDRKRRLKSIEIDLMEMYQDLFGVKYIPGLQETDRSEFNANIKIFKERIYNIRELQQARQIKEKKRGYKPSIYQIKQNQNIRDDINQCEQILKQATKRKKGETKGKSEEAIKRILQNRENTLKNCFELLEDVKKANQKGTYQPPVVYKTVKDLKREQRFSNQDDDEINVEDEEKLDGYRKKDKAFDDDLDEVIHVNRQIREQMKEANNKIDETGQKLKQNLLQADKLDTKITKATSDLAEVLLHYRRPNKLCLDVFLVLLLLALIGVIINMLKNS